MRTVILFLGVLFAFIFQTLGGIDVLSMDVSDHFFFFGRLDIVMSLTFFWAIIMDLVYLAKGVTLKDS